MTAREFLRTLHQSNPVLSVTGWIHVALLGAMLCAAPFDSRQILGVSPWMKPMKFAFSIALYTWTLGWLMRFLDIPRRLLQALSGGVALAMLAEIVCISLQSARGTTSHYNDFPPLDRIVFQIMIVMILLNSLLVLVVLVLSFIRLGALPPVVRMGIQFGLLLFLAGSLEGLVMIFNRAHTVGLADGGPGLPLLNWSTRAGDLRIAHAAGLHGIQILPLAGYAISRWMNRSQASMQMMMMTLVALVYLVLMAFLLSQAFAGRPLLPAGA